MLNYTDFEIFLARHPDDQTGTLHGPTATLQASPQGERWRLYLYARSSNPESLTDEQPISGVIELNLTDLERYKDEPHSYGKALSDSLFAIERLRTHYVAAAQAAFARGRSLRVRLTLDPTVAALHALHWETLYEPEVQQGKERRWLAGNKDTPFSRFLPSEVTLSASRPPGLRRALVVVVSPKADNLATFGLTPLNILREIKRAHEVLGDHADSLPADPETGGPVTLDLLIERLRRGYDILYLVCHGTYDRLPGEFHERPLLLFADHAGNAVRTPIDEIVLRIHNLGVARPVLIFLASCDSAGPELVDEKRVSNLSTADDHGVFTALGPRLVTRAGVPVVVAMRGEVTLDTATAFARTFFTTLGDQGYVDEAAAHARAAVSGREDWWRPVLFSALRTGALWSGAQIDTNGYQRWDAIKKELINGRCVPILGPGITARLLSPVVPLLDVPTMTMRPLDPPEQAQHILVKESRPVLHSAFMRQMTETLLARARHCVTLPGARDWSDFWAVIDDPSRPLPVRAAALIKLGGEESPIDLVRRNCNWGDLRDEEQLNQLLLLNKVVGRNLSRTELPYALARLTAVKFYVTVNQDSLLEEALTAIGRKPQVRLFRWTEQIDPEDPLARDQLLAVPPSEKQPLVYHLLGHISCPNSLVLAEDDYFEYMMAAHDLKCIPSGGTIGISDPLDLALTRLPLLFLGFQMNEWPFRAAFRSILSPDRIISRKGLSSIAVQLAPEESPLLPGQVRRYLDNYFKNVNIEAYWGSLDQFFAILRKNSVWNDLEPGP